MDCDVSELHAGDVYFSYGGHAVLTGVSVSVASGDRLALAGPNGSGKTTLVRLLSGAARAAAGSVELDGVALRSMEPRLRARRIAVVAQQVEPRLTFTVSHLVSMGRTPHVGVLSGLSERDHLAVQRAMRETDTQVLAHRRFDELSGGEQQRVMVAVALAQETDFLLLDEPTVHLDLHHQHELLQLLLDLNRRRNLGIVAVLHDLNLASLYFERIAILNAGRIVADGPAGDVMTEDVLRTVFRAPLRVIPHPASGLPQVLLDPAPSPTGVR
jgi:iron complex transport system ATP-binding protein